MQEALNAVPFFCGVLKSKQHKGAATYPPTLNSHSRARTTHPTLSTRRHCRVM